MTNKVGILSTNYFVYYFSLHDVTAEVGAVKNTAPRNWRKVSTSVKPSLLFKFEIDL